MSRNNGAIRMFDGTLFNPTKCAPSDISIINIAHGLANEGRFSGQCSEFYSVAQHSVLVSYNCYTVHALKGLLHDAPEGLGLRDIATPLKHRWWMFPYRWQENKLLGKVLKRFELEGGLTDDVHAADKLMYHVERYRLWGDTNHEGGAISSPSVCGPKGLWLGGWGDVAAMEIWSPARAEHEFLVRFAELTAHHWTPVGDAKLADKKWHIQRPRRVVEVEWPVIDCGVKL